MSLLIDGYDVDEGLVMEGQVLKWTEFAACNTFNIALPKILTLLDQIGTQVKPSKRLEFAKTHVVVSVMNDMGYTASLDFLTLLPYHKEYSSVGFYWIDPVTAKPRIQCNWDQLSGVTNHRVRVGRQFWAIPQSLMVPLYKTFSKYRRY